MDKIIFGQCMRHAKDAFKALGVKTDPIDAVGSLTESYLSTNEVAMLERKNRHMRFVLFCRLSP